MIEKKAQSSISKSTPQTNDSPFPPSATREPRHQLGHPGQPGTTQQNRRFRQLALEAFGEQRHRTVGGQPPQRRPAASAAPAEGALGPHPLHQHRRHLGRRRRKRQLERLDRRALQSAAMGRQQFRQRGRYVGRAEEGEI